MQISWLLFKKLFWNSNKTFSNLVSKIAIASVIIGSAIMIITLSVVNGYQTVIAKKIIGFTGHLIVSPLANDYNYDTQPIDYKQYISKDNAVNQYIEAQRRFAYKTGIAKTSTEFEGILVKGVGPEYNLDFIEESLVAGTVVKFSDTAVSSQVMISKKLSQKLNLACGDKLDLYFVQKPLRVRRVTVKGIYNLGLEQEIGRSVIIADIKQVQKLNNWKSNEISGLEITIKDVDKLNLVQKEFLSYLPIDQEIHSVYELYPSLFSWLSLFDTNKNVLITVLIIVLGINLISAIIILILDKSASIAILRTIGIATFKIQSTFVFGGLALVIVGLIPGNLLGVSLVLLQQKFKLFKLSEELYFVDAIPVELSLIALLNINLFILLSTSVIAILSSIFVTRIPIIKSIYFRH